MDFEKLPLVFFRLEAQNPSPKAFSPPGLICVVGKQE